MTASFPGGLHTPRGEGRPSPFGFTCPYCGVAPGAFCVNGRGQSRQLVHAKRMDAATNYRPGYADARNGR